MIQLKLLWSFLTGPIGIAIICVLAVLTYSYVIYQEGKDSGASKLINEQNQSDKKVIEESRDLRDAVDRCRARGMHWSRETGFCT